MKKVLTKDGVNELVQHRDLLGCQIGLEKHRRWVRASGTVGHDLVNVLLLWTVLDMLHFAGRLACVRKICRKIWRKIWRTMERAGTVHYLCLTSGRVSTKSRMFLRGRELCKEASGCVSTESWRILRTWKGVSHEIYQVLYYSTVCLAAYGRVST